MDTVTINVPKNLGISSFEIQMLVASRLFEQGKLSSGQAADMVGLSKRAFIEMLGKYGVSVFGYDYDEFLKDVANA